MNVDVIFKQFLSIPWRVLLHCIGVLNNFFDLVLLFLFNFCGILVDPPTSLLTESSLIVQGMSLLLLLTSRLLRAVISLMWESEERRSKAKWLRHHSWRDTVWTVYHAACNGLLLLVVALFLRRF